MCVFRVCPTVDVARTAGGEAYKEDSLTRGLGSWSRRALHRRARRSPRSATTARARARAAYTWTALSRARYRAISGRGRTPQRMHRSSTSLATPIASPTVRATPFRGINGPLLTRRAASTLSRLPPIERERIAEDQSVQSIPNAPLRLSIHRGTLPRLSQDRTRDDGRGRIHPQRAAPIHTRHVQRLPALGARQAKRRGDARVRARRVRPGRRGRRVGARAAGRLRGGLGRDGAATRLALRERVVVARGAPQPDGCALRAQLGKYNRVATGLSRTAGGAGYDVVTFFD